MSRLYFLEGFAGKALPDPVKTLLIYDERLPLYSRAFANWSQRFPHKYGVSSGESLKDLSKFPAHFEKLMALCSSLSPRTMVVLGVGGGSVGDFAGFFASVFKRGVRLAHMPSTWLAAIDSSHGGKTALNCGGKNQLGTFYPAESVILVRELLRGQPDERVLDAMGELGKIALIDGGSWVKHLEKSSLRGEALLWKFLKTAILAKYKVVKKDPREQKGHRQILNLGHTLGHVLESEFGWTHGDAVGQGLWFALEFSRKKKLLSETQFLRAKTLLSEKLGIVLARVSNDDRKLREDSLKRLLLADKKQSSSQAVTFIFLKAFGRAVRVNLPIEKIVAEALRQGWVVPS